MKKQNKTLIIGAGEAGRMLMEEYIKRGKADTIAGFLDDDKKKIGSKINGVSIIDSINNVSKVISRFNINQVIIAMPSAARDVISGIIDNIIKTGPETNIHIIPSIEKYFESVPLAPALQDITITDIIDREEYEIDIETIGERFAGKTALITGAGGSIGSELCRQMMKFRLKKIIALGRGEASIYNLIKSLNEYLEYMDYKPEIIYKIVDIKDYELCKQVFIEEEPDIVFHAAAHKHVPLMEYNEAEAVINNIGGTHNLLEIALDLKIEGFVFISTDKAVNPVSVMGVTKRIGEMLTEYYFTEKGLKTSIVRFGNVVGSRGSAIPLFKEQISRGGPVTVTHEDITRYFMSIPEASLLVLNAAAYSEGGDLFVLDMGRQFRVLDVAKRLIEFYGYTPGRDIDIKITGLRPGEKMYEELCFKKDDLVKTDNEKIFKASAEKKRMTERLMHFINNNFREIYRYDALEIRNLLKEVVPEYEYNSLEKEDISKKKFIC